MKKLLTLLIGLFAAMAAHAQKDFFNNYAIPGQLNPAFTGDFYYDYDKAMRNLGPKSNPKHSRVNGVILCPPSMLNNIRGFLAYKVENYNEALTVENAFMGVDYFMPEKGIGLGLFYFGETAGGGFFNQTSSRVKYDELFAQYSFRFAFLPSKALKVRLGIGAGVAQRSFLLGQGATFPDQLVLGGNNNGTSIDPLAQSGSLQSGYKFDAKTGISLEYKDRAWAGVSIDHLTRPNLDIITGDLTREPLLVRSMAGVKVPLQNNILRVAGESSWYGNAQDLLFNIGLQRQLFYAGVAFDLVRGVGFDQGAERYRINSLAINLGYRMNGITIGLSFGMPVNLSGVRENRLPYSSFETLLVGETYFETMSPNKTWKDVQTLAGPTSQLWL